MKTVLIYFLICFITIEIHSQISFEKGYFIDNSGTKVECFIKNMDWKNNPVEFDYKLTQDSDDIKSNKIKSVSEFGVYNTLKYVKKTIDIDVSSDKENKLTSTRNPIFETKELLLKVLIEGKASLYYYENSIMKRFFYVIDDAPIKQLVYKKYKKSDNVIAENVHFKQELFNGLKCSSINKMDIKRLDYNKIKLSDIFIKYNNCFQSDFKKFNSIKKDLLNLSIRPRVNTSFFSIDNTLSDTRDTKFNSKINLGIGAELELVFPFNKNKWSLAFEPTYLNYKNKGTTNNTEVFSINRNVNIKYSAVEFSLGSRYYVFFKENSKLFFNALWVLAYKIGNSEIVFSDLENNQETSSLELGSSSNFALGVGYKVNNKFSAEFRYQTPRGILGNYVNWLSSYKQLSLIFGYTIF